MCMSMRCALHASGQSCCVLHGTFEDSLSQRARGIIIGSIILLQWVEGEFVCACAKSRFWCFICRVARGLSRLVFLRCTGAEHEVPESSYAESRTE